MATRLLFQASFIGHGILLRSERHKNGKNYPDLTLLTESCITDQSGFWLSAGTLL